MYGTNTKIGKYDGYQNYNIYIVSIKYKNLNCQLHISKIVVSASRIVVYT